MGKYCNRFLHIFTEIPFPGFSVDFQVLFAIIYLTRQLGQIAETYPFREIRKLKNNRPEYKDDYFLCLSLKLFMVKTPYTNVYHPCKGKIHTNIHFFRFKKHTYPSGQMLLLPAQTEAPD